MKLTLGANGVNNRKVHKQLTNMFKRINERSKESHYFTEKNWSTSQHNSK